MRRVLRTIFMVMLVAVGMVMIVPLSIGNNPNGRRPIRLVIATILAAVFAV